MGASEPPTVAFVLMPFSAEFDDVYQIAIKEASEATGFTAQRLDEQIFVEGMLDRIYAQIEAADVIIADMSGKNPNVFYEVGYAHAKGKTCILLTNTADDIPFDLKHRRHIVYGKSLSKLRDELTRTLTWARETIASVRKSHIRPEMMFPRAFLEVTESSATAKMTLSFDLYNDSRENSSDIYAIYLYTTHAWEMIQEGSVSASTASDIPDYKYRYFVKTPAIRLSPNGWAQARVEMSRILASKWRGDEIKDAYTLTGTILLRIQTSTGSVDHPLKVSVLVDTLPF
jgi:hypothetical protein